MDIRQGEIRTLTAKDVTLQGFVAQAYMNSVAPLYAPQKTDMDLTKMIVRAILTRGGKETKLFNLNMVELVTISHYYNARFNMLDSGSSIGITTAGRGIFPYRFGLGTMNLKGADKIELEVELKEGFFTANVEETSSYLRIEPFKAIGVEYSTPEITAYGLEPNIEQSRLSLGNGISKILFYAKGSVAVPIDGDQALASIALRCDKINRSEKFVDLVNRRFDEFNVDVNANSRGENIMIHSGQMLNNVELDLDYLPAKITVSKYKVLVVRELTNAAQLAVAEATTNEHAYENAVAMGVQLTGAQVADYSKNNAIKAANLTA